MLHVHRHIAGLKSFRPLVLAQKRRGSWPVDQITLVPRSRWRFLARAAEKRTGRPWQLSRGETNRFLQAIEETDCALLHVFFGNVAVHLLPLLRRVPVPIVVSFHGSDVAGSMISPAYAPAVREVFDRAALVPCRSEQLAEAVARLGCPREKLRLMRTVLPPLPFQPREVPPDGAWRIVQAARLVPKKGLATALRAFAIFSQSFPAATFTIAGEGPLENALRELAAELGIADRVRFTGFLSQDALQALFAEAHIFFHPSETVGGDTEGVPNALLEAMAGGLPIVATRHGGIPEVVSDGVSGLLCNERDIPALAAALLHLAQSPEAFHRLSRQASAQVNALFSTERQIAAVEKIYQEAIAPRSTGQPTSSPL